jgi:hypothetical protein
MCFPRSRHRGTRGRGVLLLVPLLILACAGPDDPAAQVVADAIRTHGGAEFERSQVTFQFRGQDYRVVRDQGRYLYERSFTDDDGRLIREGMENDGTWREVEGERTTLSPQDRTRVETAVNSVVYFGFLPFRLDDPAVVLRDLGEGEVEGEPYRKIEVTFQEEGGGDDWEDRFVYWFHAEDHTLDYLAYRYDRDGGGTRFRRAVNRRSVGGIVLQDYENYAAVEDIADIAEYDTLLGSDGLRLVSMVELEGVEVSPVP